MHTDLHRERMATTLTHDLLVLDVSLPDGTGFEFCEKVRQVSKVPIIFLTASDEEMNIITVYMRRLRMKIEDNPSEPQMLLTVRRMGYKWNVLG